MSSFKKALNTRAHKERSQPSARAHLGLLEKKKDYVLRARDHHKKQKMLAQLRLKVTNRNPDEFYFKMQSTAVHSGVHCEDRGAVYDAQTLALMKTQYSLRCVVYARDQNYVNYMRGVNMSKIERLRDNLHIIDDQPFSQDSKKQKTQHTFFVDTDKQAKKFNPAAHLNTHPALLSRKFNRPTLDTLKAVSQVASKDAKVQFTKQQRSEGMKELKTRLERDQKLGDAKSEMDMQKSLMGKGAKKKVGVDKRGLGVYKWEMIRSK